MLQEKIESKILEAFPSEAKSVTYKECLNELARIKESDLAKAGGDATTGMLTGIYNMISNLEGYVAPKQAVIDSYSDFFKLCLKRAECFFYLDVEVAGEVGGLPNTVTCLRLDTLGKISPTAGYVAGCPKLNFLALRINGRSEPADCSPIVARATTFADSRLRRRLFGARGSRYLLQR